MRCNDKINKYRVTDNEAEIPNQQTTSEEDNACRSAKKRGQKLEEQIMASAIPVAGARCLLSSSPTQRGGRSRQTVVSLSSSFTKTLHLDSSSNSLHCLSLALPRQTGGGAAAATRMSMEAGIGVMGTKLGMMSYFEPLGTVVPVTVVGFREGNIVTQVKTAATDGYDSVQLGYRRVRDRKLTKPELGHLSKAGAIPMRHLQEFRLQSIEGFESGQRLVIEEIFKEGDLVDVSGTTIGKGFQGIVTNFTCLIILLFQM